MNVVVIVGLVVGLALVVGCVLVVRSRRAVRWSEGEASPLGGQYDGRHADLPVVRTPVQAARHHDRHQGPGEEIRPRPRPVPAL